MHVIRRALTGSLLAVVLIAGLVAEAGAYLLGYTTSDSGGEQVAYVELSHARPGPHAVGVRRVRDGGLRLTAWYPARVHESAGPAMTYSYAVTMLGAGTATALATFEGRGHLRAGADVAQGPYPVVVLSSGFAISAGSYAWLAEHLASHGMVVVAPEHDETLDPRNLWRAMLARPDVVDRTRSYLEFAARPSGDLAGLVDPSTVAVVGHSFGGYTALAAGGARIDGDAFTSGCASAPADDPIAFLCDALLPRIDKVVSQASDVSSPIDAVVSLAGDAAMFGESGLAAVTAPLLAIGGTADRDSPFAWSTQLAYDGVSSPRKVEVALEGAEHFVFAGPCASGRRLLTLVDLGFCSDPVWDRGRARAVVRSFVTAFLVAELADVPTARAALASGAQDLPDVGYRAVGYQDPRAATPAAREAAPTQ